MRAILIIEPDSELCCFISALLSQAGYIVRDVPEASLATALLCAEPVDVVLTDFALRGRPGAESLEPLRRQFPRLSVIAMSASNGCTGYLRLAATLRGSRRVADPFMSSELKRVLDEKSEPAQAAPRLASQRNSDHAFSGRN